MSSPSNSKRAHESQTVDNLRKKVKAGNACGTAEGTINHQPSAIDQAPSTSSQNSTISQFATVCRPRSLNANNSKPATGSHDIQTPHEYIITLPDHLVSCQDEMERLIKNSVEDIEKNNEILRGIKRLKDEGKLEEVRSRCYEVLEFTNGKRPWDYLQKQLNLTYNMTNKEVKKFKQRLNMSYKKKLACWQGEMEKLIKYNLEPIEENGILIADRKKEEKLEKVRSRCYEVFELFNGMHPVDYLQKQLNLTFNLRDYDVRRVDVTFYYLLMDEKSQEPYTIIHKSLYPRNGCDTDNFYELCCEELQRNEAFVQLYKRLNNNQTALEYLLYKKPGLLFDKKSDYLINHLIDNTQLDVRQIITDIRDEKGQTYMFYMGFYMYSKLVLNILYSTVNRENLEDLYELLSIQNCDGQTALHVNMEVITSILADIYTPKQREAFIKLTSIKDNRNRTALEIIRAINNGRNKLSALMNRVKNNEYVMNNEWDTRVLIIYNTNNRPGAEEEAQTIFNAMAFTKYITFKKNKNETDLIQLIKESANKRIYPYGPPIKSLIVILTSHGSVGTIEDCDGNPIELSAIEQAMCSDTLDGLPKMLITQCCQNTMPEVDKKLKAYAPTHPDFCAVMSSVPGQKSTRGVFLGKLAEEIKKINTDTTIFKLVNNVSREMGREGHSQTPIIMNTLKSEFCPLDEWDLPKRFNMACDLTGTEKDSATNVDNDCPKNADGKKSVQAHSDTLKQKPCFDNITDAEARLSGFTGNSFDENHDIVRLKCETCGIILNSQPADAVTLIDLHSKHMPYCPFIESKTSSNVDQVSRLAEELDVTDGASSVVPDNLVVRMDAASTQTTKPSLLPFLKSAGSENDNRILNLTTQYARTLKGSDESKETLDNLGLRTNDNDLQQMGREENRKKTFLTYPNHKALKLTGFADNGWFWTGVEDEFKCFRCDAVCSDWHSSVDPFARHIQLSPDCPFLLAQYILEYRERILKENPTYTTPKPQDVIKNPPNRLIRPHAETRYATMIVDNYSKFYDPIDREIVSADDGLNIRTVGKKMIWRVMAYSIQYGIEVHSEDKIWSILQIIRENKRSSLAESSGVSAQEGPKAKATADPDYIQYDEEIRQKLLNSIHLASKPKVQNVKIVMNVEEVREQLRCTICLDSLRSVLFTPCCHLAACAQCGFTQALCPVCRRKIQATIKVDVLPSSTLALKNKGQPICL